MLERPPPLGSGKNESDKGGLFDNAGVAVAGAGTGREGACSEIVACPDSSGSGILMCRSRPKFLRPSVWTMPSLLRGGRRRQAYSVTAIKPRVRVSKDNSDGSRVTAGR